MALSLSCTCGARLEVDEKFAGQVIGCPDCQRPVRVPQVRKSCTRTSGLALASLLLAVIGAFTVVGTLAAAGLGFLALRSIARQPERLGGERIAWAGLVLGIGLTVLTLVAHAGMEWLGLDRWLREPEWAGKLDYNQSLELRVERERYSLSRPSQRWGVLRNPSGKEGPEGVVLVNVADDAQFICLSHGLDRPEDMEFCRDLAVQKIRDSELAHLLHRNQVAPSTGQVVSSKTIAAGDGQETLEVLLNLSLGGRERLFLFHVIKARNNFKLFVVGGGTRKNRFPRLEGEIRKILDSFKLDL